MLLNTVIMLIILINPTYLTVNGASLYCFFNYSSFEQDEETFALGKLESGSIKKGQVLTLMPNRVCLIKKFLTRRYNLICWPCIVLFIINIILSSNKICTAIPEGSGSVDDLVRWKGKREGLSWREHQIEDKTCKGSGEMIFFHDL